MRETLTTVAEVAGLVLVAVGIGLHDVPAGMVAGGLGLVAVGVFGARQ